jgi:hypothetical protein
MKVSFYIRQQGNSFINTQQYQRHPQATCARNNGEIVGSGFSTQFVPRANKEAGRTRTSTVTLRVVGGDEKGSLKSETIKYGHESQGTRTRERLCWRGPEAYIKGRPVLSSERAPHKNKTVTIEE